MAGIYEQNLERRAANYAPLTPISFIARTAYTWPFRTAVVHGARRYTWAAAAEAHRNFYRSLHNSPRDQPHEPTVRSVRDPGRLPAPPTPAS